MNNQEKIKEILNEKGKALSDLLKENFNPYTAIVITSTEVKIVQVESCIPTEDYFTREYFVATQMDGVHSHLEPNGGGISPEKLKRR